MPFDNQEQVNGKEASGASVSILPDNDGEVAVTDAEGLDKFMVRYLKAYPLVNTFFVTSDLSVFLEQEENSAINHQRTINAEVKAHKYTRPV